MASTHQPADTSAIGDSATSLNDRQQTPPAPGVTRPPNVPHIASESSDEGIHLSPAAARRFARRNLRRNSPTPDLVTSLVRPPSPDTFYVGAQLPTQARQDVPIRAVQDVSLQAAALISNAPPGRRSGPMSSPHPSSLDIPKRYGGDSIFDMYALTYVNDPDTNLLCPICHDPIVDPVTTPCDHTFCYRCIRQSIESSPSGTACPIDRDPLRWSDCFSAARLVRTQLNSLIVKCPNYTRGCKKELRRENVESHATTDCRYNDYACPRTGCEKRLRFKPTDDACLHRTISCKHCDASIQAADSGVHLLSCPMSKTRCQSCWQLVYRNQLTVHHDVACDGVEIGCPYQEFGCPARCARGQMDAHVLVCAFHPETASGMIIRSQRELIRSYGDFGGQLQQMVSRQNETTRKIEEITQAINRRGGNDAVVNDNRTIQDLDAGFEEIHQNLTHLEARQSMWTLNQVMPIREEVTELRNNINMIRMHVNWLLNRSREEGRNRAANNPATSTTIRRDESSGPGPRLPERRRSSSTETDLPRL